MPDGRLPTVQNEALFPARKPVLPCRETVLVLLYPLLLLPGYWVNSTLFMWDGIVLNSPAIGNDVPHVNRAALVLRNLFAANAICVVLAANLNATISF